MKHLLLILVVAIAIGCTTKNTSLTEDVISLNGYWKFNTIPGDGSNFLDERPRENDILVDDKQTELLEIKGKWQQATEAERGSKCWGASYLKRNFAEANEEAFARFKADAVPKSGYYEHLVLYPFTNHNAAIVNVKHANGNFSTYFNMKNRTGVWHSLGVFRIEKGGDNYIEFTSPSKGGVCADAVIFRPVTDAEYEARQLEIKNLVKPGYDDSNWQTLKVPGHWGMINKYANYSGKGWYRTEINLPNNWEDRYDERTRIRFEGVYHIAKVYFNGKFLGTHQGGFTPFEFDVSDKLNYSGKNVIAVEADNSYTVGATWNWGGIIRDVSMVRNKDVRITYQYIHAEPNLETGTANYTIQVRIANNSAEKRMLDVKAEIIKDKLLHSTSSKIEVEPNSIKQIELNGELATEQVKLWHFDNPELYFLETTVKESGKVLHQRNDRFGIRKFEATKSQMILNGEPVRLVGFNRVSDHRYWGSSEPQELINLDVDLMKTAGANFMRIMHGTQNKKLIERCDEKGIMIFEEANIRDIRNPQFAGPNFGFAKQWIREMIERDINHPSIVGWSTGNELQDHFEYVKTTYEYAKSLDPHRMALHVSNQGYKKGESAANNPLEYGDMIFQNIYQEDPGKIMDILHERWPNKAMFFSEFGWSDVSRFKDDGLDNDFKQLGDWYGYLRKKRPYTTGASIWTYNDYRSGYTESLPCENRAWGMVNAWRTKRRSFYTHLIENSPVTNFQIKNIDLKGGKASVSFDVRDADDFPCFTMRNYKLRYSFFDKTGGLLLKREIDLPLLKPGFGTWDNNIEWDNFDGDTFELSVELVSANGYTRGNVTVHFYVPEKPEIREVKTSNNQIRVHFSRTFGAFEYFVKYKSDGIEKESYRTIANYIDLDRLVPGKKYELMLVACNNKGESSTSDPITVKTHGQSLAPIIWDGFIADNKLVVGYSGQWEDEFYTVRYGASQNQLNSEETTNARGMMTVPLSGERSIFFQIKRSTNNGDSQWSNVVEAKEGVIRIYE